MLEREALDGHAFGKVAVLHTQDVQHRAATIIITVLIHYLIYKMPDIQFKMT